jgi:hypothetical protein
MAEIIGGKRGRVGEEKRRRGECPEMICAESEKVEAVFCGALLYNGWRVLSL